MWLDRLENAPPFGDIWLAHQRRDDYWKQGSVCEDFAAIEAAVYAIGGWADGYTNAIPRLLEGLPGPRKGLIGPWAHAWPQAGPPEPTIGFLQETLRWWDHWLKGEDTGIMDEPMLRSWIQEPVTAGGLLPRAARALGGRPVLAVAERRRAAARLRRGHAGRRSAGGAAGRVHRPADGGLGRRLLVRRRRAAADWPGDQRAMDGMCVCFTGEPLAEPLEILGYPEVDIELASDRPLALVAVRLCEVSPGRRLGCSSPAPSRTSPTASRTSTRRPWNRAGATP